MAIFSRVKTWVSNEILTATDLNGEFNNILTHLDASNIEGYSNTIAQMQTATDPYPSGVESLAGDIAGELQRIRHQLHLITGKTQWYQPPVSSLNTAGILTASLADLSVTTAKINDLAVTQAKRAALPYILSSSCGNFTTTSATAVDVTNLSVSLVTTGRPVWVGLVSDGTTNLGGVGVSRAAIPIGCAINFLRGATVISTQYLASSSTTSLEIPNTSFSYVDFGTAAGTTTYKVQQYVLFGATNVHTAVIDNAKLLAYEL